MKKYQFRHQNKLSVHNKLMEAVKNDTNWMVEQDKVAETVLGWISGTSKALEVKIKLTNWKSRKSTEMTIEKIMWLFFLPYIVIGGLVGILLFIGYSMNLFDSIVYVIFLAFEVFLVAWCVFQYYRTNKTIDSFFNSLKNDIKSS